MKVQSKYHDIKTFQFINTIHTSEFDIIDFQVGIFNHIYLCVCVCVCGSTPALNKQRTKHGLQK